MGMSRYRLLLILISGMLLCINGCSNKVEREYIDTIDEHNQTDSMDNMPTQYNIDTESLEGLSFMIPYEWENNYYIDRLNIEYNNGEEVYIAPEIYITNFMADENQKILDIVSIPKREMMNYLNWGTQNSQFFMGYNDEYYYFSSGSFGISNTNTDDINIFTKEAVTTVVKNFFEQENTHLYWEYIFQDSDTVHGRNDNLPFQMNIEFLYDINESYSFVDETGNVEMHDIVSRLLNKFADDLCTPRDNWRFTIKKCEAIPSGPIYDITNKHLLSENLELIDFYENGELDPYLKKNFWILVSHCKVYDFEGFLPLWSSGVFHALNEEFIGAHAGVWVIEKKGTTYYMYRPAISFVGQDS